VLQVVVVPLHRVGGPGALQTAGDGVDAVSVAVAVGPAEALLRDAGALGFGSDILDWLGSTVGLAEGVAAGNERDRLLVIHGHAAERLPDVPCRGDRIGRSVGPFRINVNQTHLHSAERIVELAVAGVALIRQPLAFRPPEDVLFGLPDVRAPAAET